MILLIDIGNTRIKWATLDAHKLSAMQAASYAEWDCAALRTQMLGSLPKLDRVLVSNVGGITIAQLLCEALKEQSSPVPEFIAVESQAGGVRCGYANPAQLGVDRWLGVIAAYNLQRAGCVVNVGTAMTIDGIDASGQHLGGLIAPGPDLAIAGLMRSTSDLATRAQSGAVSATLFADNTFGAIHQGVAHMLAALVDRSVDALRQRLNKASPLILSGGACDRIAPLLRSNYQLIPDLVLRGLAALARQ